jgi:hypothetical protein
MKHPDPKKHLQLSLIKSAIRIIASAGGIVATVTGAIPTAIMFVAVGYGVAEIVGVYEELV